MDKNKIVYDCAFCGDQMVTEPIVAIEAVFSNGGKKQDGTRYRFVICESCYDKTIESRIDDLPF